MKSKLPSPLLLTACLACGLALPSVAGAEDGLHVARYEALPLPVMSSDASPQARREQAGRAYAIDGARFYFEGLRVEVADLAERPGLRNEHARQRLQAALDAGELSLDGRTDPVSGALRARVWVDGRALAELLE